MCLPVPYLGPIMSDLSARFSAAIDSGETLVAAPVADDPLLEFARSVAAGLSDEPKWLHCRFLYNAEGSRLFEKITEQPEYYLTRTEEGILAERSAEIREITGPVSLVELGSGYSVKTEHLLSAYLENGDPVRYVPVDVSDTALREANRSISENFSDVQFTGINGTYRSAFPILKQLSPQMVIFLGSSIGNFNPAETTAFWRRIASAIFPLETFSFWAPIWRRMSPSWRRPTTTRPAAPRRLARTCSRVSIASSEPISTSRRSST